MRHLRMGGGVGGGGARVFTSGGGSVTGSAGGGAVGRVSALASNAVELVRLGGGRESARFAGGFELRRCGGLEARR